MADANQEAQELANILARLNQEMLANGQVSQKTQQEYTDAVVKSKTGIQSVTKAAEASANALGSMVGAVRSYNEAMAEGTQGAKASNQAITGMADAAKSAGQMLAAILPLGPVAKLLVAGFTALTTATAEQIKKANEQADTLNRGYRSLSKSGAVAAEGMSGVFKGAQTLGLSMQELDGYVALVNDSSKDLALFAGSAFEGRRQFEDMGKAMMPFQQSLMNAGMSQMEITEGTMGYLRLQARLGQAQGKTTDQLAEGAKKYLLEQDALTKLTGQSRKEMEDQRARAMQQQQFAAKVRELQMQGRHEEAEQLMQLNSIYAKFGPKTQAAFQASVTGNLANADALGANIQSQNEMMRTAQMVASGQMTAVEAAQATGKAMGKFTDTVGVGLAQVNAFNGTMGDFAEGQQARILAEGDMVANLKKAQAEQEKQGATGKKAADATTQAYTEMVQAQQKAMLESQQNINALVGEAIQINTNLAKTSQGVNAALSPLIQIAGQLFTKFTELVEYLADKLLPILERFTGGLLKIVNSKTPEEAVKASGEAGMAETVGKLGLALAGMKAGAALGAGVGSAFGGVGAVPGAVIGGTAGAIGGYFGGGFLGRGADAAATRNEGVMDQLKALFNIEGRAVGGPVKKSNPYLVGERGPELMMPNFDGQIINNQQTRKLAEMTSASANLFMEQQKLAGNMGRRWNDDHREWVDAAVKANTETLNEFVKLDKLVESDVKISEKFNQEYKSYSNLRMRIMELEKPMLEQAIQQLQDINAAPSVGPGPGSPGAAGGSPGFFGNLGAMMSKVFGGLIGGGTAAGPAQPTTTKDLSNMGLRIKQGDVQAEGAKVSPKLLSLAQQIQNGLPDFAYFSGFNDKFHQEKSPSSKHTQGLAADFVLSQPPTPERGQEIVNLLKGLGASTVIDEYNQPSSKATAGHIHVQVPEFEYGGEVVGPDSGYMAKLHGQEAVIPINNGAGNFGRLFEEMTNGIHTMNMKMDELVRAQRNSVDIQGKILKANY